VKVITWLGDFLIVILICFIIVLAIPVFTIRICMDFKRRCVYCGSKWTYVFSRLSVEDGSVNIDFGVAFLIFWRRYYRMCLDCRQEQFIKKVRVGVKNFSIDEKYADNLRNFEPDN
jgi:hypothetical protein